MELAADLRDHVHLDHNGVLLPVSYADWMITLAYSAIPTHSTAEELASWRLSDLSSFLFPGS